MNTEKILQFLGGAENSMLTLKPTKDEWSILECMEHLLITENGIYRLLNRPELFSANESNWLKKVEYYRNNKVSAPDFVHPKGRFASMNEILNLYIPLRNQIEEYIEKELQNAGNETAPHPVMGPLTKSEWIEFLIDHGERHLRQMKRIAQDSSD